MNKSAVKKEISVILCLMFLFGGVNESVHAALKDKESIDAISDIHNISNNNSSVSDNDSSVSDNDSSNIGDDVSSSNNDKRSEDADSDNKYKEYVEYKDVYEIKEEDVQLKGINVYVKGYVDANGNYISKYNEVKFPDLKPIIVDGRTLVPIRAVAETIGFDVEWAESDETITIGKTDVDSDEKLSKQCESMLSILEKHCGSGDGCFGRCYNYFGLTTATVSDIKSFKDRLIKKSGAKYGVYLTVGQTKGTSFVSAPSQYNLDELRVDYNMDVSSALYKDRTVIPLRAVGEMLGFEVLWDESSSTVYLNGDV